MLSLTASCTNTLQGSTGDLQGEGWLPGMAFSTLGLGNLILKLLTAFPI